MSPQLLWDSLQFRGLEEVLGGGKGKDTLWVETCNQSLGQVGVSLHRNVFQQVNGLPHQLEAKIQPYLLLTCPLGDLLATLAILRQYHAPLHCPMSLPMTMALEGTQRLQA